MRTLLLKLHPASLAEVGLPELLRQLVEATSSRGAVTVDLQLSGEARPLPAEVNIGLYRLVQESLNNVSKHAEARNAWVKLAYQGDRVDLEVRDDGRGFDPNPALVPSGHFGLGIMRERADALGAVLALDSQVGEGTVVRIAWQEQLVSAQ